MKQIFLILAGLLIIHIALAQQKTQRFAIKSGYIEYTLSGNTTGIKKIWWNHFGESIRTEIKSETLTRMFGMKNIDKRHTIEILVKDKYWTANLIDQSGQKGNLPYYQESRTFVENMTQEEQEIFAKQTINALGGEKLASENFMGKSCDIIKIMGSKLWIYKGITLKSETKTLGMISNETATKFNTNQLVSSSKFTSPSGIIYNDIDSDQQNLFGAMNDMETTDSYDSDKSQTMIPVKYPYGKFLLKANSFSYEGYKKISVQTTDDMHNATFMKGFENAIIIAAISRKNGDISKEGQFDQFTHKGQKYLYGKASEDEDNMILIIDIPEYDTYITIGSNSPQTKQELLEICNHLNF